MTCPPPFRTLDDVVTGLEAWEAEFLAARDRRSVFLTLYGVVSRAIRAAVQRGSFHDNNWAHAYAVAFANLYRDALLAHEDGRREQVPKAWRLAFRMASDRTGLVLQDMLLGVNAHVNRDLPLALTAVTIDPDRDARYADHTAVNAVLASVTEEATERLAALYAPGLSGLDKAAGELDELLGRFSLRVGRESAWETAVALANARSSAERGRVTRLMDARAAVMARLLRAPSLSPTFMAACRHLETGPACLDALAALRRDESQP